MIHKFIYLSRKLHGRAVIVYQEDFARFKIKTQRIRSDIVKKRKKE